jgi:hypothetical protein
MQIQPNISQLLGVSVGIGWGLILNGVGHLLVTGISLWHLWGLIKEKRSVSYEKKTNTLRKISKTS